MWFFLIGREELLEKLKELQSAGYKYIARDKESNYLTAYSLKPKKYMDMEGWGYKNPDESGVLMAYPISNVDVIEINWKNRTAVLIDEFLNDNLAQ